MSLEGDTHIQFQNCDRYELSPMKDQQSVKWKQSSKCFCLCLNFLRMAHNGLPSFLYAVCPCFSGGGLSLDNMLV